MHLHTLATLFSHSIKEYITHWDAHLSTFWVPLALAVIFLILAIQAIAKDQNIRMCILYIILLLCCGGYLYFGDEVVSKLAGMWK